MRKFDKDATLGLFMLAALAAVTALGLSGALLTVFSGEDKRTVRATFSGTQTLTSGDDVRIQGVPAGEVKRVALDQGGRSSTVTMEVLESAGPLYADAGAVLRWKTVLGGTFYVDLKRGSAARGPLSAAIPSSRTDRQVELEDVAAVVNGDAKQGLQRLPSEVADALADPQAPSDLLDTTAGVAPAVERGVGALRGQEMDRDLRGLVAETSRTVSALDAPDGSLRRLVSGAAATLQTTAARNVELRETIGRGDDTTREVDVTLNRLRTTLGLADPLLAKLEAPADDVAPTLRTVRPVLSETDQLARRAVPLLDALRPAVTSLAGTARRGLPLVRELLPSLDRLDRTILPMLNEVDEGTKKTTAIMIGGTFTGLASGAAGQMDANGHFIRFPATIGSSNVNSLPCQVYINNPDAAQIAACQELGSALTTYLNYKPFGQTPGTQEATP